MAGILISKEEHEEYKMLKAKNSPMKKNKYHGLYHCPKCNYVVDYCVPKQNYCDRCGQKLK